MSVAITAAAISASSAAAASAAAQQARVERCKVEIAAFDAKKASVEEARSYASCVQTVYPTPATGNEIIAMKSLFALALICGIGTVVMWHRDRMLYGPVDWFMSFMCGFIVGPLVIGIFGGLLFGVVWLFI